VAIPAALWRTVTKLGIRHRPERTNIRRLAPKMPKKIPFTPLKAGPLIAQWMRIF
jgi:hypothetical protein